MIYLLLSAFLLLAAWAFLSWQQQKNYQEALRQLYNNKRLLGVGHSKSLFHPGRNTILILALNQDNQKICGCRKSTGIKGWQPFEEIKIYNNYSLNELRELAIFEDASDSPKLFNLQRDCHHKGALLQAIEALDRRRLNRKMDAINQKRLKKIDASLTVGVFSSDTIIEDNIVGNIENDIGDNIVESIENDIEDNIVGNIENEIGDNIVESIENDIEDNIVESIENDIGDNIVENIENDIEDTIVDDKENHIKEDNDEYLS